MIDDREIKEDLEEVMKKYDRESNVRIWEGTPALIVRWVSALFSLYCIYVTLFSTAMPEVRLNVFLGLILIIGYLHYPIRKTTQKVNHIPIYDIIIMLAGVIPFFYFAYNAESIIKLSLLVTRPRYPYYYMMVTIAVCAILSSMTHTMRCRCTYGLCVLDSSLREGDL